MNAVKWIGERIHEFIKPWYYKFWSIFSNIGWDIYWTLEYWTRGMDDPWRTVAKVLFFPAATVYVLLKPLFQKVWEWMPDWMKNLPETLGKIKDQVWEALPDWVKGALNAINKLYEMEWDMLWNFLRDPVGALKKGWETVSTAVGNAFKGVQDWWNANVAPHIDWLKDRVAELPKNIEDMLDGAGKAILGGIEGIGRAIVNFFFETIPRALADAGKWLQAHVITPIHNALSWLWNMLGNAATGVLRGVVDKAKEISDRIKRGDWMASFELLSTFAAAGLGVSGIMSVAGIKIAGTGLEVGELSRFVSMLFDPSLVTGVIIGTMLSASVGAPLRTQFNRMFRPTLPDDRDIEEWWRRGLIDDSKAKELLASLGYADEYIDNIVASFTDLPSESDVKTWFLRGYIDEGKAREYLRMRGYTDEMIENTMKSWWIIPSVSDLISFVVKEVISPEEFYKYAAQMGLSKEWAKAYWDAHWQLPAFGQLREAMWRGIITEEEYKKYIVWHDYLNVPRPGISKSDQEIMFELSYELPGRIDARWMYEQGAIDMETLTELYKMTGLHPDWIDPVVKATALTVLRTEKESLIREAMYDLRDGWLTEEEFDKLLEELEMPERLRYFWKQRALMLREREIRDQKKDILVNSYRLGIIDAGELRDELRKLGMVEEYIDRLIELEDLRKAGKSKGKSEGAAS